MYIYIYLCCFMFCSSPSIILQRTGPQSQYNQKDRYRCINVCCYNFCSSHILSSIFYSPSSLDITQTWGHWAGSPPPSSLRCAPSFGITIIIQLFLPSSTRVELCLPTLQSALRRQLVSLEKTVYTFVPSFEPLPPTFGCWTLITSLRCRGCNEDH